MSKMSEMSKTAWSLFSNTKSTYDVSQDKYSCLPGITNVIDAGFLGFKAATRSHLFFSSAQLLKKGLQSSNRSEPAYMQQINSGGMGSGSHFSSDKLTQKDLNKAREKWGGYESTRETKYL
jgi:hypothetical protein